MTVSDASETSEVDLNRALLHFSGSLEDLSESFDLLIELCPSMIADVEDAFAAEKAPDLTNTVHSLKGALSNFFPRHLVSILQAIETRSHTEPPPQLRQDWVLAQTGIQSFLVDMRQALTELQTKRSAV